MTPAQSETTADACAWCKGVLPETAARDRVYCSDACRAAAYRSRHAPERRCAGCNRELVVGETIGEREITPRYRYCSDACKQRVYRWRRDGRILRCHNEECAAFGVERTHNYDDAARSFVCPSCGQMQPAWLWPR